MSESGRSPREARIHWHLNDAIEWETSGVEVKPGNRVAHLKSKKVYRLKSIDFKQAQAKVIDESSGNEIILPLLEIVDATAYKKAMDKRYRGIKG